MKQCPLFRLPTWGLTPEARRAVEALPLRHKVRGLLKLKPGELIPGLDGCASESSFFFLRPTRVRRFSWGKMMGATLEAWRKRFKSAASKERVLAGARKAAAKRRGVPLADRDMPAASKKRVLAGVRKALAKSAAKRRGVPVADWDVPGVGKARASPRPPPPSVDAFQ